MRFTTMLVPFAAASAATLLVSSPCPGQSEEATAPAAGPNTGALHFDLGVDWTSAYYFRGLLQEKDGLILQPWAELGVDLTETEGCALTAALGIWNSFHGETDTAGASDGFTKYWYEFDAYGTLALDVGDWSFDATYVLYASPSDAFSTIEELIFSASYDDSALWSDSFALNPSVELAIETNDRNGTDDTYIGLGIAPGFDWELSESTTLEMSVPVTVGLSPDDYYLKADGETDTFGYLEVGLNAALGLPVAADYGAWTLGGGVHLLMLGTAAEQANDGDDTEVIARVGLSISY